MRSAGVPGTSVPNTGVRLKPLLVPGEHGGWGFLLEPIVIALIAAPTAAAAWLAVASVLLFLSRQPLKVALDDVRQRRRVPRTRVAWRLAAACVSTALAAVALATRATPHAFWLVAGLVAPLAVVTVWFDSRGASRHVLPELAGATALGGVAGAAGHAAGWPLSAALALWVAALVRVLPAIVTVRERVQRLHGHAPGGRGPAVAHLLALACGAGLARAALMPWGVTVVALLLAARAAWDLRPWAPPVPAMRMGMRELVTGLVAATAIGLAWRLTGY